MKTCTVCQRPFPAFLVNTMVVSMPEDAGLMRRLLVCPICALEIMNELHGESRTAFDGETAEALHLAAKAYVASLNVEGST